MKEERGAQTFLSAPVSRMDWNTEYYRRNLPHIIAYERPMFITFGTKERRRMPPCARNVVLERCVFGHQQYYWLNVVVVMPDHVHLVLTIPRVRGGRAWKSIMKGMKGPAAHAVKRLLGWDGSVWQSESFDRVIRSGKGVRNDRLHSAESGEGGSRRILGDVSVDLDAGADRNVCAPR
jgi:REP element-mobilizing transposase RayT